MRVGSAACEEGLGLLERDRRADHLMSDKAEVVSAAVACLPAVDQRSRIVVAPLILVVSPVSPVLMVLDHAPRTLPV
jgi:hypothetical protein